MGNYVITIARGYGSGGRTVGKMLAKNLGISYYDREILRMASDDSGINEALFAKADEKLKSSLLYKIAKKVYKGELIAPDQPGFISNNNLFNYQAKVIKELSEQESFVIIGRAANFILKDDPNVVRVYMHAPLEQCLKNLRPLYHMTDKELEDSIEKIDKERSEYYKYHTGQEWIDARNYDLCLNSNELSFDQCMEIIKDFIAVKKI